MRTKRLSYRKNPLRGENLWVRYVGTAYGARRLYARDPPRPGSNITIYNYILYSFNI